MPRQLDGRVRAPHQQPNVPPHQLGAAEASAALEVMGLRQELAEAREQLGELGAQHQLTVQQLDAALPVLHEPRVAREDSRVCRLLVMKIVRRDDYSRQ